MAPLRIGLVGGTPGRGWAGRAHVPAYRALPDVELVALCTAHPDTAVAAAKEHGVTEYYDNYQDLVRSPNVDVISVVTKVLAHHEIAQAALEAGKHVYSEWPLDVSESRAVELAALAKSKGLRHAVGLQARFCPPLLHMKSLIESGYIGQVMTFNLSMFGAGAFGPRTSAQLYQARKESGAGTLTVSMGHSIDGLRWLLGDIQDVSGLVEAKVNQWTLTDTKETVDVTTPDNIAVIARLQSGATGTVHSSNTAPEGSGFRLEVYGTEGKLTARSTGLIELSKITLTGAKTGEAEHEMAEPKELTWVPVQDQGESAFNIAQLFSRFAQSIREGKDFSPGFVEAARLHHLLETIDQSSQAGRRLPLE